MLNFDRLIRRARGMNRIGIRSTMIAVVSAVAGCVLLAGCERKHDDIETEYGERSETRLASSVNGYSVLADMFAKAGDTVSTQSDLTPELKESADAIVYAPDSFAPPDEETVTWFEQWLLAKSDRTLIYIGRDFDAAPLYWRKIRSQVPAKDRPEVDRRKRAAQAEFLIKRSGMPKETTNCKWFNIASGKLDHRDVRKLAGDWSAGTNENEIEIELNSRIEANDEVEPKPEELLTSPHENDIESDLIAFRKVYTIPGSQRLVFFSGTSQLIVVANGSFLVNLALVNKEHRKLAQRLIKVTGKSRRVVILHADAPTRIRSGRGGGGEETAGVLDVFGVWPLSVILIQWIVVLALFCFSRWPIFGPPRDPPPAPASDFARHIGALAESWELTRDSSYAHDRWQYYQDHVRGEPGAVVAKRSSRSGPPRQ
jgi:hypothetical protein